MKQISIIFSLLFVFTLSCVSSNQHIIIEEQKRPATLHTTCHATQATKPYYKKTAQLLSCVPHELYTIISSFLKEDEQCFMWELAAHTQYNKKHFDVIAQTIISQPTKYSMLTGLFSTKKILDQECAQHITEIIKKMRIAIRQDTLYSSRKQFIPLEKMTLWQLLCIATFTEKIESNTIMLSIPHNVTNTLLAMRSSSPLFDNKATLNACWCVCFGGNLTATGSLCFLVGTIGGCILGSISGFGLLGLLLFPSYTCSTR